VVRYLVDSRASAVRMSRQVFKVSQISENQDSDHFRVRFSKLSASLLHLRHSWAPTSTAKRTSQVDAAATGIKEGEGQAHCPQCEQEPEESCGSLQFSAAAASIVCAVGQMVAGSVVVIAAGMYTKLGRRGNGSAEKENDIEQVNDDREYRVARERLVPGDQEEIDQRQQCECCDEHIVVDQRGVASKSHSNDVADERHDDYHDEELDPSQDEVERPGHHLDGWNEN